MLYCEAELCLAASTFGRGGILSENLKDGKVTVHSAKNTSKFDSTVGRYANCADQINLGVAAALRNNIYGGVPRATSLTTTVAGGVGPVLCMGFTCTCITWLVVVVYLYHFVGSALCTCHLDRIPCLVHADVEQQIQ